MARNYFNSLPNELNALTNLEHINLEEIFLLEEALFLGEIPYCQVHLTEGSSLEHYPATIHQSISFVSQ